MKVLIVDDDFGHVQLMAKIIKELRPDAELHLHDEPIEALRTALTTHPDILFIDRVMTPMKACDGPQFKKFIDTVPEYSPYCVLVSGAPQYCEIFDHHFDKPITISKVEAAFKLYENRDRDMLREYLESAFPNRNDVDFLYDILKVKKIEQPTLQKQLFSRMAELFDSNAQSVKRRIFRVIERNPNVFEDGIKYTPHKFIEKLRYEADVYVLFNR